MKEVNYSKLYKVLLFCIVASVFVGCKSSKTIISGDGSVVAKGYNEVLDDALSSELKYNTINAKTSLELVGKSGMKVNCYIKFVRDQDIQMSIRAPFINTELFRVNLTPDSVIMVDRYNKRYVAERIKDLDKDQKVQFNYYNIQALLTNSLFIPGKKSVSKKDYDDYSIKMVSGLYQIQTKDKSGTLYNFDVDSKDRIISTLVSSEQSKFNIKWSYLDFIKDASSFVYPTKIETQINIKNKSFGLNISYSELEIDKEVKIDKQIPSKYTKSSIQNVLRAYFK